MPKLIKEKGPDGEAAHRIPPDGRIAREQETAGAHRGQRVLPHAPRHQHHQDRGTEHHGPRGEGALPDPGRPRRGQGQVQDPADDGGRHPGAARLQHRGGPGHAAGCPVEARRQGVLAERRDAGRAAVQKRRGQDRARRQPGAADHVLPAGLPADHLRHSALRVFRAPAGNRVDPAAPHRLRRLPAGRKHRGAQPDLPQGRKGALRPGPRRRSPRHSARASSSSIASRPPRC